MDKFPDPPPRLPPLIFVSLYYHTSTTSTRVYSEAKQPENSREGMPVQDSSSNLVFRLAQPKGRHRRFFWLFRNITRDHLNHHNNYSFPFLLCFFPPSSFLDLGTTLHTIILTYIHTYIHIPCCSSSILLFFISHFSSSLLLFFVTSSLLSPLS